MENKVGDPIIIMVRKKKRALKVVWIDDTKEREPLSVFIERASNKYAVDMLFCLVQNKNIANEMIPILKGSQPNLVILDHFLNNNVQGFVKDRKTTGTTVAQIFKEKWPKCPIIGITAATKKKDLSLEQEKIYTELFELKDFKKNISRLLDVADTFCRYKNMRIRDKRHILGLLNAPQDVHEQLLKSMPEGFNSTDSSCLLRLYKWIRFSLFMYSGFLHDNLQVATYIGLKAESFKKIEKKFIDAKFDGIFFNDSIFKRWWPVKIKNILHQNVGEVGLSWKLGHKLKGVEQEDYALCHKCGEKYPEIVGYTDDSLKKMASMHIRCSQVVENYQQKLFYEQVRKMKDGV